MSAVMPTLADLMAEMKQQRKDFLVLLRMQGAMKTRKQMMTRYDVCNATLNSRVAAKIYPSPGPDGLWLLSEILEFEDRARQST